MSSERATNDRDRHPEQANADPNALLIFGHGEQFPITITDPFSQGEETRLEWYFEEHLRFPFTHQFRAQGAAASVGVYGERLFEHIFADGKAYAHCRQALQSGVENLSFEIAGSPHARLLDCQFPPCRLAGCG